MTEEWDRMADRPTADSEHPSASYSPPPNHRPGWIGEGWGSSRGTQGRQGAKGGWAGTQPASDVSPAGPAAAAPAGVRTSGGGGVVALLTVAIIAAALASAGTYGILAASGQLDGQRSSLTGASGQQASTVGIS